MQATKACRVFAPCQDHFLRNFRHFSLLRDTLWLLLLFPVTWLAVLPANFLVDSLVLLGAAWVLKVPEKGRLYKRSILKVWGLGFAADLLGSGALLGIFLLAGNLGATVSRTGEDGFLDGFFEGLMNAWYEDPASAAVMLAAVALAGWLIYVFNKNVTFQKQPLEEPVKKRLALALAVFTAPYALLIPTAWLGIY